MPTSTARSVRSSLAVDQQLGNPPRASDCPQVGSHESRNPQDGSLIGKGMAMLGSETRMSVPPTPPPSLPPTKNGHVLVALAIAAGIFVLAVIMWLVAGTLTSPQPEEVVASDTPRSATAVTSPSPVPSPSPGIDRDRALAIITDAHSGKYFSNRFQETYPRSAEKGMVLGMIWKADQNPMMADAAIACTLSFIESHSTFREIANHPESTKKLGTKAGFACLDYFDL
jgi:hypothetical protein